MQSSFNFQCDYTRFKKLLRIVCIALLIQFSFPTHAQTFNDLNITYLKGGYHGFSSFVDYNNDGHLDVFVTGVDFVNRFNNAVFYENNGDSSFSESNITSVPRVIYGDHSWADFDNNGTMDLLYSGTTSGFSERGVSKVFRNIGAGCEFVEVPLSLPGVSRGTSDWVDIDNDGLLDIFLAGNDINDEILVTAFKNQGGDNFVEQNLSTIDRIPGGRGNGTLSSAQWADFDGDGLPDVILALSTDQTFTFELYKNLGDFLFEKQNIGLPRLSYMALDVGDVNNDGLIDMVFSGSPNLENSSGDGTGDLYVFTNNGNMSFTNSFTIPDEGVFENDVELADFDNDGFLDLAHYGTGPWGHFPENTKLYRNNGNGTFSNFSHTLPQCRFGGIEFGDFDNDNDLDILYFGRIEDPADNEITYIYENTLLDVDLPSEILAKESCICDNTVTFTLNNETDTITWDFGDPTSGAQNNSTDKKASHIFSAEGSYTISATFTKGAVTNTITKAIEVTGLPSIQQPGNLTACRDASNNQYDLNTLKDAEILNGTSSADFEVFYYSSLQNADNDLYRIPMPYVPNNPIETIYARVQSTSNSSCYLTTDFQVVLQNSPVANEVQDIFVCDTNNSGFGTFDLSQIETTLVGGQVNTTITYYNGQGTSIPAGLVSNYQNAIENSEIITARITDNTTTCYSETTFELIVTPLPVANDPGISVGCDENNDGISEFFDTSSIEAIVLGNQTGLTVSYYDSSGNLMPNLPNPYTNVIPNEETIVVRVTDTMSQCYAETDLILRTSERPNINPIDDLYGCDEGNGFAFFDTSQIASEIRANRTGLSVSFFDEQGNLLTDFGASDFMNQTPFQQRIFVRLATESNDSCYSEESFNLVVNRLPQIELEDSYFICDLEPSLDITVNPNFDTFQWIFEDGSIVSTSSLATISQEGNYTLTVNKVINNINCSRSFPFSLVRSDLPEIVDVEFQELSENNYIQINADGDGDFEYSLDGINYVEYNRFEDVVGGVYTVFVRDKKGCGEDSREVVLIDYPKFFTPNGDDINDFWQIQGVEGNTNSSIIIHDRYGRLVAQFSSADKGWNGVFNGRPLPSSDYWFTADLGNGKTFKGHFSLKR